MRICRVSGILLSKPSRSAISVRLKVLFCNNSWARATFCELKLIPELIDAGVQVLNPVQISAKGMDPRELKTRFGKDVVFWGGGADMQRTVNEAHTPEEVYDHVRELLDIFAPGGGYIFAQVHNILDNVPPEKVMAIFQAAMDYREEHRK